MIFSKSTGLTCCWSKDTNVTADSDKYAASAAAPGAGYTPGDNPLTMKALLLGKDTYLVQIHWVVSNFTSH